jgi:putative flippase GtrA
MTPPSETEPLQDRVPGPDGELHPTPLPVVPLPQDPFIPRRRLQAIVQRIWGAQFIRYVMIGVFNTLFGFTSYVVALLLLNKAVPQRFLYLTVVLASVLTTPVNITVAYFGYKFVVFRTKGNYLREWFKCFAVYGTGMLPGLFCLSALTRLLQSLLHRHAAALHAALEQVERHLSGKPLLWVEHTAHGKSIAGILAGAIVTAASTVYSYVGHRKVTFRQKPATQDSAEPVS